MNPRLPCDLYEPCTCISHPLTPIVIQAHPERSGLHIKCPLQDILTLQCRVRIWAVIPDGHDIYWQWALWYGKEPRSFYFSFLRQ